MDAVEAGADAFATASASLAAAAGGAAAASGAAAGVLAPGGAPGAWAPLPCRASMISPKRASSRSSGRVLARQARTRPT
eukprot:4802715-Prymnesium_polylepis.1